MSFYSRLFGAAAAAALALAFLRQNNNATTTTTPGELEDFPLLPGPWFQSYLFDWMAAHGIEDHDDVTSGIAIGAESGDYIWATATPEWDRQWFATAGFTFPRKWVPFYYLESAEGDIGDSCRLRGL